MAPLGHDDGEGAVADEEDEAFPLEALAEREVLAGELSRLASVGEHLKQLTLRGTKTHHLPSSSGYATPSYVGVCL